MPRSIRLLLRHAIRVGILLPLVVLGIAIASARGIARPWSEPTPGGTHPDDATWSDEFALPGFNRDVTVALPDSGRLLVFGRFTSAPGVGARLAASWDGASCSALGVYLGGMPATAIRFRDSLMVMGAGNYMYRWDGSTWVRSGSTDFDIYASTTYQGDLVIGGIFTRVSRNGSTVTAAKVARWNGSTWSGGFGTSSTLPYVVRALLATGDSLWIAGSALSSQSGVRLWTGSALGTPGAGLNASSGAARVNALLSHQGQVYAGGWFQRSGTTPLGSTVARFDGSTWVGVGHATGEVTSLVEWNGDLLALISTASGVVKPFRLEAGEWVPFGDATGSYPSLSFPCAQLVAGGSHLVLTMLVSVGTTPARGMAVYEGGAWHAVEQPWSAAMHGVSSSTGIASPNLLPWNGQLLAGNAGLVGQSGAFLAPPAIASWDGSAWSAFPAGPTLKTLRLRADDSGRLVAGGVQTTAGGDLELQRWNGGAWESPWAPTNGHYVSDFLLRADGPWLGGSGLNETVNSDLARWDGVLFGPPDGCEFYGQFSYGFNALLDWGGRIVAGTDQSMEASCLTSLGANLFIREGTQWSVLGDGTAPTPSGEITSLVEHEGGVVVGAIGREWVDGAYLDAWPISLERPAARWDGVVWHDMSSGALFVTALLSTQGRLFAGGGFLRADSSATWGVAEWDGARWNLLGSGMNGFVRSLAVFDGDLYASGEFGWANGKSSVGIARWRGLNTVGAPGASALRVSLSPARPNPASGAQRFAFTLPAASPVQLAIYDVSGRRVATRGTGRARRDAQHAASWDGRDADGAAAAPGLYFARLRAAGGVASATVVRVK